MDRITNSLIQELLTTNEITSQGLEKDFEKLANYSVVSNEYNKTFDIDEITVGSGGDTAIDGIAIIVNGQLVNSIDEVKDLIEKNNYLEVDYIFIQAKTSSNFDSGDISKFLFGVQDFFEPEPSLVRNEEITSSAEISNFIYEKASKFRRNPIIKLYYVTTGKWLNDKNLNAVIKSGEKTLEQTNLFDDVFFYPLGVRELTSLYRKTKDSISTTFTFGNRITIPQIGGVSQAYIGLLPYPEFLKIVADSELKILNVFEDNVRDFQGENNDVNNGIATTLKAEDSEIFSVLNNGVTIVASSISPTGDRFTITDYQIVNGCQTSNVLYNNKDSEYINKVYIPIKLIATTDDEVKTRITLATNNQTPIKREQLAALTQFQRNLEQYYNSFTGENKLYYERRAKQYNTDNSIVKSKIITVPIQIKSFAAMFLEEPHNVTSYFGTIVKKLNENRSLIFGSDHLYSPYYTSAYAYYKLESFFRRAMLDASYKKTRFHILMLFRLLYGDLNLPPYNSKKMDKYCEALLEILDDEHQALEAFKECINVIEGAEFDKTDKQDIKLVSKTKILVEHAKSLR